MQINDVLKARGLGTGSKLSGDALPAHVRAGKTFMNADGEQTGTLPVRATTAQTVTPGTANITKTAGIYDGDIVIEGDVDLITGNIKAGVTIFGVTGKTEVIDTTEASVPAVSGNILTGKKAFVNGALVTGSMADRGAVNIAPGTTQQTIPAGYHNGSGTVAGDANLINSNIRAGVTIFGVTGSSNVVDTTEAAGTAAAAGNVLTGKNFFVNGSKIAGSMADRGAVNITPGTTAQTIAAGYHNGSGSVAGDTDLVSANIRAGVNIFGVDGKAEVVDTTEATAPAAVTQIRSGRVAYVNGAKVTGTLAVQATGTQTVTPGTADIIKPAGIYDGAITIAGDGDLLAGNIAKDTNIFNVQGTLERLTTTEKTNLANAVNAAETGNDNLLTAVKTDLKTAITAKGGTVPASPTFGDIKTAIDNVATWNVPSWDSDLIAANIKTGVNIFSVVGTCDPLVFTAGDTDIIYNGTKSYSTSTTTTAITKYVEVRVAADGTLRCTMDLNLGGSPGSDPTPNNKGYIYVNGVKVAEQLAPASQTTYTFDINIKKNDLVQFYASSSYLPTYGTYFPTQLRNCKLKIVSVTKATMILE